MALTGPTASAHSLETVTAIRSPFFNPTAKGTLEKRIDSLPAAMGVTPAMKEWAHQIRHLGNDAAHEDDPFSKEEADSLQAFTELFLTYVFTLPGMLAARKPTAKTTAP